MFRTDLFSATGMAAMVAGWSGSPVIVDGFAGGSNASTGIEMALGHSPDIAINHCLVARAKRGSMISSIAHFRRNFLARYWRDVGGLFRDIIRSRLLDGPHWVGQGIGGDIWWNFLGPFRIFGAEGVGLGFPDRRLRRVRRRQARRAGHRDRFIRFRAHDGLLFREPTDARPFLFRDMKCDVERGLHSASEAAE